MDEAFKQMLIKIVGGPMMSQFCRDFTVDFVDMFREFETKKRQEHNVAKQVTLKIPVCLKDMFEDETEEDIKDVVNQSSYSGSLIWIGDKLRIARETFDGLFSCAIGNTISHLQDLLDRPTCKDAKTIIMVGGFSESPLLQKGVRDAFPRLKVIIPQECSLSVLKGAVIFGHNPSTISSRKAKCTYGIATSKKFNSRRHRESKKIMVKNEAFCKDVFDRHLVIGATLDIDVAQSNQKYTPLHDDQSSLDFPVYQSPDTDPDYVTDAGCKLIGTMSVKVPNTSGGANKDVRVKMIFGGTELKLEAKQETTGEVTTARFNFLGDSSSLM